MLGADVVKCQEKEYILTIKAIDKNKEREE